MNKIYRIPFVGFRLFSSVFLCGLCGENELSTTEEMQGVIRPQPGLWGASHP
jgi:hypothetical protein